MLKKFVDAKARIWGDESHSCTIIYEVASGKYFAECESILSRKRLTEKNYEEVLNDMFYDYCVKNADWMGVS
ncbi:hypothetical protein EBS40_02095 [bacterium]|nr:hypothetical protein [bacterium]